MAYSYVLAVSTVCTDKQHMYSVKFHLNDFSQIFVANSFAFALLYTFYCIILEIWCLIEMCVCFTVCDVACLIICMLSVCFLSGTLIKCLALCQVFVDHFVTLTEVCAALGSHSSRIVVQRFEEIFYIM